MPTFTTSMCNNFGSSNQKKLDKRYKRHPNWKWRIKLSLHIAWSSAVAFVYTNIEHFEKEITKTVPFAVSWKKNEVLKINLMRWKNGAMKAIKHC